ncbi:hypothetical protein BX592_108134 [Paraburkholderia rhizosphaerae]|uniref:Uncharacterized protein n=1 Tax=Paraburkholderia rhizosphaerae TaxID=480658 RepID=A0A4R8LVT3_9BURK|nr:hypothetical protein BX592_108134 [Paraburkholderia rhizosphaerae]
MKIAKRDARSALRGDWSRIHRLGFGFVRIASANSIGVQYYKCNYLTDDWHTSLRDRIDR